MTRREEILKQAKNLYKTVDKNLRGIVELVFTSGAEWADKHPVGLWHLPEEEPEKYRQLLISMYSGCKTLWYPQEIDKDEVGIENWEKFVEYYGITKWLYINDLLTK